MNLRKCAFIACLICHLLWFGSANADTVKPCEELAGLTIIGELEYVTFSSFELKLKARIDTGAQTSSISATDIIRFERDGKKWVRFSVVIPKNNNKIEIEGQLVDTVKIKRHDAESQERKVVQLPVIIGGKTYKNKFTLTDRTDFKFPVLIGRDLLSNRFVVDVNRRFTFQEQEEKE